LNTPGVELPALGKILEWFQGRMECDVDDSARPQTVEKEINPLYWRLIDEFGKRTGVPVVMNTSFNLRGEAIVHTPTDAIGTFFRSGMDALVIGSFLVEK
jgi:carbamoyltransferase